LIKIPASLKPRLVTSSRWICKMAIKNIFRLVCVIVFVLESPH
jgi:hypothetical protein